MVQAIAGTATPLSILDDGRTAGYVTLAWNKASPEATSLLQMKEQSAPEVAWATIYQGLDTATTLSGLNNGIYEVRLQTGPESWSPPLEIAIKHHSLTKAYSFFALGLVLFIFLLGLLLCAPKSAIPPSAVNSKRI